MNPNVEKTASLIPEFYYDLLARILPGGMFYACADYAWWGVLHQPRTLLESFFVVAACYVIGFIIDLAGDLILVKLNKHNAVKNVLNALPQVKNPQIVNLLVKMCAEVVLLRSLLLISSIFFCFLYQHTFLRHSPSISVV